MRQTLSHSLPGLASSDTDARVGEPCCSCGRDRSHALHAPPAAQASGRLGLAAARTTQKARRDGPHTSGVHRWQQAVCESDEAKQHGASTHAARATHAPPINQCIHGPLVSAAILLASQSPAPQSSASAQPDTHDSTCTKAHARPTSSQQGTEHTTTARITQTARSSTALWLGVAAFQPDTNAHPQRACPASPHSTCDSTLVSNTA